MGMRICLRASWIRLASMDTPKTTWNYCLSGFGFRVDRFLVLPKTIKLGTVIFEASLIAVALPMFHNERAH
jgi:hypothetical protein